MMRLATLASLQLIQNLESSGENGVSGEVPEFQQISVLTYLPSFYPVFLFSGRFGRTRKRTRTFAGFGAERKR